MTAYSKEDQTRLLSFAAQLLTDNGFPKPIGFRAGGWFADGTVLSSLVAAGFLYDASGHEQSVWNGLATSPWNLSYDSEPYFPSENNQNVPGEPSLPVLEIPDAGGNTYEHSVAELIRRFDHSLSKTEKGKTAHIVVTHPQWPDTEFDKVIELLNYAAGHTIQDDLGPVQFVTADEIYQKWKK
jgi:hypothetical protein